MITWVFYVEQHMMIGRDDGGCYGGVYIWKKMGLQVESEDKEWWIP